MITVNYTMQELQAISKLLDLAVKSGGLQVAGDAFLLHQKHLVSLQMAQEKEQELIEKANSSLDTLARRERLEAQKTDGPKVEEPADYNVVEFEVPTKEE